MKRLGFEMKEFLPGLPRVGCHFAFILLLALRHVADRLSPPINIKR